MHCLTFDIEPIPDVEAGRQLLDLMRTLNREHGVTFVFSTHDPMVMDYSTRLVRLKDGQVDCDEKKA